MPAAPAITAAPAVPAAQRGGGCIVNLASVAALHLSPDEAAYASSKAGMRGWSLACYEVGAKKF